MRTIGSRADGDVREIEIAQVVRSRDGYEFKRDARRWRLGKDVTLDLDVVLKRLRAPLRSPYRRVLQYYAEHYSPGYCSGIHQGIAKLLRDRGASDFSVAVLRRYRTSLDRQKEYRLGYIRAFLKRWHDQGYPGVSTEAVEYLASLRLRGNPKGSAVLSLDPRKGPFDDQELGAIIDVAAQAYEGRRISLRLLAVVLLLIHTGRRPGQLSHLRAGDLQRSSTSDGRSVEILGIPRTKQRGRVPRSDFKDFWLSPDVARVLVAQRDEVVRRVEGCLGPLPRDLVEELPFFPAWQKVGAIESVDELRGTLRFDELHTRTQGLTRGLGELNVLSARTGARLHINPRRCRYTLATRAARQGYGPVVIAELVDHSDVQNVKIYTRIHPNFRKKVDKAVGKALAPLARAFTRQMVESEDGARNGDDPSMRIGTRHDKVGTCGSVGFCGAQAAACYTCMHFQPWADAPHEKMLEWFLAERQRAADVGAGDHVVAATDRSILGAQAVIAACRARETELAGGAS